ncbi:hypothetical protein RO575_05875 [Methylomonas sp. MO1]|uniref:hypothetical protein n=1 Tax=Methylomonas sp. MO1 TaxID=3073619 RepID=UPI0028A526BB|nr:hypothetical protein [Methylomonas sp. MO1]MDT4289075.1 hypothetical protein [Methylomonas sp. MO1]
MRQIVKVEGREPEELAVWKRANPHGRYHELDHSSQGKLARQAIRRDAIKEQFGLCGYCCKCINLEHSTNEHVISQQVDQNQTLNFANIIASCDKKNRCNQARGTKELTLTPLMPECEIELKFYPSGKVKGKTERASEVIEVLGLDKRAIREERKQLVDALIYNTGSEPDDLELLGVDLLNDLVSILDQPDESGILPPYSPALINIIRGFLSN